MYHFKYQGLAKAVFCVSLFLNTNSLMAAPLELEGENLIGPKRIVRPKQEWETEKPQGEVLSRKINTVDYFTKMYPDLLDKASKNLPREILVHQWIENSSYEKGSSWK
jgi:hypothetical protein